MTRAADYRGCERVEGDALRYVEGMVQKREPVDSEEHLRRVRRICAGLPETTEKLSHGEPTVWIPAAPGFQAMLIKSWPDKFFRPPYVGVRGWVGIELAAVDDEELASHLRDAWSLVAPKKLRS